MLGMVARGANQGPQRIGMYVRSSCRSNYCDGLFSQPRSGLSGCNCKLFDLIIITIWVVVRLLQLRLVAPKTAMHFTCGVQGVKGEGGTG